MNKAAEGYKVLDLFWNYSNAGISRLSWCPSPRNFLTLSCAWVKREHWMFLTRTRISKPFGKKTDKSCFCSILCLFIVEFISCEWFHFHLTFAVAQDKLSDFFLWWLGFPSRAKSRQQTRKSTGKSFEETCCFVKLARNWPQNLCSWSIANLNLY